MSLGKEIIDLFAFLTNSTEDYHAATELAKAKAGFETSGHHIAQELEVVDSTHSVVLSGNRNTVAINQAAESMGVSPLALENLMSIRALLNGEVCKIVAQGQAMVEQIRASGQEEREKLKISGAQQITQVIAQCNSALEQLKQSGLNQLAAIQAQGNIDITKLAISWINDIDKYREMARIEVDKAAELADIDVEKIRRLTNFDIVSSMKAARARRQFERDSEANPRKNAKRVPPKNSKGRPGTW